MKYDMGLFENGVCLNTTVSPGEIDEYRRWTINFWLVSKGLILQFVDYIRYFAISMLTNMKRCIAVKRKTNTNVETAVFLSKKSNGNTIWENKLILNVLQYSKLMHTVEARIDKDVGDVGMTQLPDGRYGFDVCRQNLAVNPVRAPTMWRFPKIKVPYGKLT